jgi:hypothetical protein
MVGRLDGRQSALHIRHSEGDKGSAYTVSPGNYQETLVLDLPAGSYKTE